MVQLFEGQEGMYMKEVGFEIDSTAIPQLYKS